MACSHVPSPFPADQQMHVPQPGEKGLNAHLRREGAAWAIKRYQRRLAEVCLRIDQGAELVAVVCGAKRSVLGRAHLGFQCLVAYLWSFDNTM